MDEAKLNALQERVERLEPPEMEQLYEKVDRHDAELLKLVNELREIKVMIEDRDRH